MSRCPHVLKYIQYGTFGDHLQGILDTLPDKPGCYLMKDSQGRIIYVGKAVNLRARVRSYFHAAARGPQNPQAGGRDRRHRVDRGRLRAGSADPRDEPDQAPPAALQRAPEGRQALPLHQGALGRTPSPR
jgi:hypothetical protein